MSEQQPNLADFKALEKILASDPTDFQREAEVTRLASLSIALSPAALARIREAGSLQATNLLKISAAGFTGYMISVRPEEDIAKALKAAGVTEGVAESIAPRLRGLIYKLKIPGICLAISTGAVAGKLYTTFKQNDDDAPTTSIAAFAAALDGSNYVAEVQTRTVAVKHDFTLFWILIGACIGFGGWLLLVKLHILENRKSPSGKSMGQSQKRSKKR